MSHIEIHIDELVLYGFAPADRWRISQAIEHELTLFPHDRNFRDIGTVIPSLQQKHFLPG